MADNNLKPLDFTVLGSTGLKQYGGVVAEEFLPRLHGVKGVAVYREMADNSSTVGAILYAIESLIRQAEWRMEPAGDSPDAKEQAEFVDGCLDDMSHTFVELLMDVLSMVTYGWSYHELVYKLRRGPETVDPRYRSKFDDGKVGWRKMPVRSQTTLDRWEFDPEDNGLRGMWQFDPYALHSGSRNYFIPIEKALLFRTSGTKGNPEGRSLLRNAVLDWSKLKRILEIEGVGIERDMTGLLTMEVPMSLLSRQASLDEVHIRKALEKMLAGLKRDEREFAMIPPEQTEDGKPTGYKLKLLTSGGRRQIDTVAIAKRYMDGITMSVLADFLMLGQANVGSWALASSKTRLFSYALGAIMDAIADVFNRFAIPRLMRLNSVPSKLYPHLVHGDIETPPLDEIGAYITALATSGMLQPTQKLERKLLEIAHLPAPDASPLDVPLPGEGAAPAPAQSEAAAPTAQAAGEVA